MKYELSPMLDVGCSQLACAVGLPAESSNTPEQKTIVC